MADIVDIQRHIVRRPRLTNLLDESPARLKLLIAPAGYGKTTLAQQWLESPERRDVWYRGGPASADVAALAAGLATAVADIFPGAGTRTLERLRATGHPEEDVDILADLFAEDLQQWPADAWLAIDDYQFAMESVASERFVDLLTQETQIQLLITTRRRPAWATARRILYGEIQEIDHRTLSMNDVEVADALGRSPASIRALLHDAKGWPAVIGLVALNGAEAIRGYDLATVEAFFAEEMLSSLGSRELDAISVLALADRFTSEAATLLLGDDGAPTVQTAARLGIVSPATSGAYSVHPLLKRYLGRRVSEVNAKTINRQTGRLLDFYLRQRRWDDAFELAKNHSEQVTIPRVVSRALDSLLVEGRLATLTRWLDYAHEHHVHHPVLDLTEAELAFRLNDHARAEELALQASRGLLEPSLVVRSLIRAGYAAALASRERISLDYFRKARKLAVSAEAKREALLGEYYAASELGDSSAQGVLDAAYELADSSPEGRLRVDVMRLTRANRLGGLADVVAEVSSRLHLVERARDPLVSTAFLHALATALNLAGQYEQALDTAHSLLAKAERFGLALPLPHAQIDIAVAQLGLKQFDLALQSLDRVRASGGANDPYLAALTRLVQARLSLVRQRPDAALVEIVPASVDRLSPPARAELAAVRALALIRLGRLESAQDSVAEARTDLHTSVEARVIVAGVETLCAPVGSDHRIAHARELWDVTLATGNLDSFVCIYRTAPEVLLDVDQAVSHKELLMAILHRMDDLEIAERLGLRERRARAALTAREREVAGLLLEGLSNQEIASRLYISLATAKVHVRHIYEKLGVRNRAGALSKLR